MKRPAAILLVGILFFNWYGYQLLTQYLQQRSDRWLEARPDRNEYDESLLHSVKIAITALAYYNSSPEFQRVNGHIEIGGVRPTAMHMAIAGVAALEPGRGTYVFPFLSLCYSPTDEMPPDGGGDPWS